MRYFVSLALLSLVFCAPLSASAQINVDRRVIPTNVTLVWEAESYVPPFYKGKALLPDGGNARIVAFLPPGMSDSGVSYTWRINGTIDGNASGMGRNTYSLRGRNFGGVSSVIVEASNSNGVIGAGALRTPITSPLALMYVDAPLAGVLFNIESPRATGEEVALETYPLFFTAKTRSNIDLIYSWKINGFTVGNPAGNSPSLVLRSDTTSNTTAGVSVANKGHILESARRDVVVTIE